MIRKIIRTFRFGRVFIFLGVWHLVYYFLKKPTRIIWGALTFPIIYSVLSFMFEVYIADMQNQVMNSPPELGGLHSAKNDGKSNLKSSPNDPAMIMKNSSNVAIIPPFTKVIQDGTSPFNVSITNDMSRHDYNFYASHFRYAMRYFPASKQYKWLIRNDFYGFFEGEAFFKTTAGITCRKFREMVRYNDKTQSFSGHACMRHDGGWCKLRNKSSLTCDVGTSGATSIYWRNKINGFFSWF
jgi:surface antigen